MTTIRLEGLDFFAHHGFYEEERKVGNKYTVDVEVTVENTSFTDDDLTQTINYEEVYLIISTIMSVSTKLLETLASSMCREILKQFDMVQQVTATVKKHNPPIKGVCKHASVSIAQSR